MRAPAALLARQPARLGASDPAGLPQRSGRAQRERAKLEQAFDDDRMSRRALVAGAAAIAAISACASVLKAPADEVASVEEDMSVFTLFAMLNAAGYDDENADAMHAARLEVRAALAHSLNGAMKREVAAFYARVPLSTWHYSVAALATSGAPSFEPTAEWRDELAPSPQFAPLADLTPLLRRFFVAADIPSLYAPVRPAYRAYVCEYRAAVAREVAAALEYLRFRNGSALTFGHGELGRARVIPNLLDSHETAFSFILDDRFISVEGPQRAVGYNPHEFIHAVTNRLSYDSRHGQLQTRAGPLYEAARAALGESAPTSIAAFFDECLVRAISLRYLTRRRPDRLAELEREMHQEFADGWLLERHFWAELGRFETQTRDLAAFYPAMLAALDPDAELAALRALRPQTR